MAKRLQEKTKWSGPCLHRKQTLDTVVRKVLCADCGCEMDPFDLLVLRSRKEGIDEVRARNAKATAKRLETLLAEEKRAKARVRNAKRKDADAAVRAERQRMATALSRARHAARRAELLCRKIQRHLPDEAPA